MATYIDAVAKAGKDVYDLPMYINIAGLPDYDVLDIWKWFTPHIKIIGPDIYIRDSKEFDFVCAKYTRATTAFRAGIMGGINMLTLLPIIIRSVILPEYQESQYLRGCFIDTGNHFEDKHDAVCVCRDALILKYRGTGKIQAIMQPEKEEVQKLDFDGFTGIVEFGIGVRLTCRNRR